MQGQPYGDQHSMQVLLIETSMAQGSALGKRVVPDVPKETKKGRRFWFCSPKP